VVNDGWPPIITSGDVCPTSASMIGTASSHGHVVHGDSSFTTRHILTIDGRAFSGSSNFTLLIAFAYICVRLNAASLGVGSQVSIAWFCRTPNRCQRCSGGDGPRLAIRCASPASTDAVRHRLCRLLVRLIFRSSWRPFVKQFLANRQNPV